MAVLYEVNLQVEPEIEVDYLQWLNEHIKAMLKYAGFIDAKIYMDANKQGAYVVQYTIANEQDLDNYLLNEAPKMRANGINRFGNQFQASRRILKPISHT